VRSGIVSEYGIREPLIPVGLVAVYVMSSPMFYVNVLTFRWIPDDMRKSEFFQ